MSVEHTYERMRLGPVVVYSFKNRSVFNSITKRFALQRSYEYLFYILKDPYLSTQFTRGGRLFTRFFMPVHQINRSLIFSTSLASARKN